MNDSGDTKFPQVTPTSDVTQTKASNRRFPDSPIKGVIGGCARVGQITDTEEASSLAAMLAFVCANDNVDQLSGIQPSVLHLSKGAYDHSCAELVQTLNSLLQIFQMAHGQKGGK